jgi:hypothetical protein
LMLDAWWVSSRVPLVRPYVGVRVYDEL